MARQVCAAVLLILLYLHKATSHADYDYIQTLRQRIDDVEEDMHDGLDRVEDDVSTVQDDVKRIRTDTERKLKRQIRNVKSEWKHSLKREIIPLIMPELVSEAVEKLQKERKATDISRDDDKEVRHLRQQMQILKHEMSVLRKSFGKVVEQNNVLEEQLLKMNREYDCQPNLCQTSNSILQDDSPTVTVPTTLPTHVTVETKKTSQESATVTTTSPTSLPPISAGIGKVARRLLVVPFASSYYQQLQTLKIGHHWSEKYNPYPVNTTHVLSAAYVASRRTLLLSTFDPDVILSYPLDRGVKSVLKMGVASSGMAIDEGRQLVIHTNWRQKSVNIIPTSGDDYIPLLNLHSSGGPLNGITVDEHNMLIYVCDNEKLYSLTYIGLNFRVIFKAAHLSALAFHPEKNLLYFSDNSKVLKYFPSNDTSLLIDKLSVTPKSIQLLQTYGDRMFLSGVDGGILDVIYLGGNFRYHLPRPGWAGYIICLIH